MRGLWQRGIALYFIGDYKRAAKQFEEHRKVNPNDVENAAWHFLCVAKAESFAKARELILPAPNDRRVPLKEIHQMLKSGDTDAVKRSMNRTPVDSNARADAKFYGDFYLGLYADATGDREAGTRVIDSHRQGSTAPLHGRRRPRVRKTLIKMNLGRSRGENLKISHALFGSAC